MRHTSQVVQSASARESVCEEERGMVLYVKESKSAAEKRNVQERGKEGEPG